MTHQTDDYLFIDDIFLKNDERLLNVQLKKCNAGENFVNDLTSSNYNLKSENVPDAWLHILDFNYGVHRCAILGSFINHVDMTGVRGERGLLNVHFTTKALFSKIVHKREWGKKSPKNRPRGLFMTLFCVKSIISQTRFLDSSFWRL